MDKVECNLATISIPVCLSGTNNRSVSNCVLEQSYAANSLSELLPQWRLKLEKFELFLQIKHNNYDFAWCDTRFLQSPAHSDEFKNRAVLTNGHKMTSAIKAWKTSKVDSIKKTANVKPSRLPNILNKKCVKKLMDESLMHLAKSFLNTNTTKVQEDSFISNNLSTTLEANQFIRSDPINERNDTLEPSNPVSLICQEDTNHQMDSNSLTNSSYSSYFNMLTYCSSNTTYFQHANELNEVNLVEPNVDDLLNQNEDIEHDKFMYF